MLKKDDLNIIFSKENLITSIKDKISTKYEIKKILGKGAYGKVYQVKNKITQQINACKQISKKDISNIEKLANEISILKKVDHPNIIKLYEIFEDEKNIYLIMEKCNGGELFDKITHHIRKKEMFKEKEAAYIFFQIISSLYYLHSNGISHRDLKPENLLYYYKGNDIKNPIKLIDFDLSIFFNQNKNEKMKKKVGTSYYVSPEVLNGEYNEKCDIWSAGVILYILLSGQPPFNGSNDKKIYKKIMKLDYNFNKDIWKNISFDAIDLIKKCICFEKERLSAKEILSHKWFNIIYEDFYSLKSDSMLSFNFDNLIKYSQYNSFKKIILNIIIYRLNDDVIKDLKNIFFICDFDHDGIISKDDFKNGLKKLNINNENIENIFSLIDSDKDGFINYTEFLCSLINEKLYLEDKRILEAFLIFETNEKGKLPNNEIEKILNNDNEIMINDIIVKIDKDCEINFCDFYKLMELNSSKNCN